MTELDTRLGPVGRAGPPDLATARRWLLDGSLTSTGLLRRCLDRIGEVDPVVNAVLALDQNAEQAAAAADRRYASGTSRGPLDGIPVLVKDNIDTAGLASTAGSRLLAGCPPRQDAAVVARLRAAGAVIVGKANLSEWGNFRSRYATEGWSAVGGQTRNPHRPDRSPWGSSAGPAAAVAAGMVPLAVGTETDGSVVCPAGACGVVGVKPELGLVPTGGIVPVSSALDTAGVLAARVADAASCLSVLAGRQPAAVEPAPLAGLRFGRWSVPDMPAEVDEVLTAAGEALTRAGAVVEPVEAAHLTLDLDTQLDAWRALLAEFGPSVEGYLRSRPGAPGSLPELIAANLADPAELALFDQALFEQAAAVPAEDRQEAGELRAVVLARARRLVDQVLARSGLAAVLAPTNPPAWVIDHDAGDPPAASSSTPAALAGYPNVSVPAGVASGLPVGVSVFGPPATARVLSLALAVESALG